MQHFRNCPLRPPILNGKPLNLYKLYHAVTSKGGWIKVSNQDKWDLIAEEMGYSDSISMIDNGIKLIYVRYLSKYEEVQTIGDIDDHDVDMFGSKSRSKQYSVFASGDCPIALPYRGMFRNYNPNNFDIIVFLFQIRKLKHSKMNMQKL